MRAAVGVEHHRGRVAILQEVDVTRFNRVLRGRAGEVLRLRIEHDVEIDRVVVHAGGVDP